MIRVHRPPAAQHLTGNEQGKLAQRQAEANGYGRGDPHIKSAWKNVRKTLLGRAMYRALRVAFRHKCVFCERVGAGTADHFYPKERYPRRMFRWSNLLLCCGECNPLKGDFFPFRNRRPVLIDPTREDPSEFFTWDFQTGAMVESADPVRGFRAKTTRDRLKLDEGPLRDERRMQLERVLYLLARVSAEQPIGADTRRRLQEELAPERPYLGMLRFLFREPNAYGPLLDAARVKLPDIDIWTAAWL